MGGLYAESAETFRTSLAKQIDAGIVESVADQSPGVLCPGSGQEPEAPKRKRGRPPSKNPKKPKKRNNTLTERYEQEKVVAHCEKRGYPFFAIPNAARRTIWEAMFAKRGGMKAGVPDLCFPVPMHFFGGLWVEMKRIEGGIVSPIQHYWLALLAENNFQVHVAHGAAEAIPLIDAYFEGWRGTSSAVMRMLEDVQEAKRIKYAKDKLLQAGISDTD